MNNNTEIIQAPSFLNKRSKHDLLKAATMISGCFKESWLDLPYDDILRMVESLESMHEVVSLPKQSVKKLELLCSPALTRSEFLMIQVEKEYVKRVKSVTRRLDNAKHLRSCLEKQLEYLRELNE